MGDLSLSISSTSLFLPSVYLEGIFLGGGPERDQLVIQRSFRTAIRVSSVIPTYLDIILDNRVIMDVIRNCFCFSAPKRGYSEIVPYNQPLCAGNPSK